MLGRFSNRDARGRPVRYRAAADAGLVFDLPTTDLLAYYPLLENANDVTGNYNATAYSISWNNGAVFNGTSSYLELPAFGFVDRNEATMIMRIEIDTNLSSFGGLYFDINSSNYAVSAFRASNTQINTNCYPNTSPPALSISALRGVVAFTRQSSNSTQKIIFNSSSVIAALQSRGGQGGTITSANVGRSNNGGSPEYYFKGKIAGLAFYNRVLSDDEIKLFAHKLRWQT